jgi:peptidoglycan/LPS O-acetylase OafA/YrhL
MMKLEDSHSRVKEVLGVQYLRGIAVTLVVMHHLYFENTQLDPFAVKSFALS